MTAVADRTRQTIGPRLELTPHETLMVRRSTPELIEVEVELAPGAERPPGHLHPAQDESFEVLAGTIGMCVDGVERTYGPGGAFEVPRGAVHQMWNAGDEPARAIWQTTPGGRTHDWFVALDAFRRSGRVGREGMPGVLAMAVLLTHYRDVFQLAARPRVLVRAALAALGVLGRLRGYRPTGRVPGRLPPR